LENELQHLVYNIKNISGSTAVYIGKVAKPIKAIKDGDDEFAHINSSA